MTTANLFEPEDSAGSTTVKALSLWQPWASLWLSPYKIHETRRWAFAVPSCGFRLAVHAALRIRFNMIPAGSPLPAMLDTEYGVDWFETLPTGAVIGAVFVTQCLRTQDVLTQWARKPEPTADDFHCGDYSAGRFAFRRTAYRRFAAPVPWRGRQGPFNIPRQALPEWPAENKIHD